MSQGESCVNCIQRTLVSAPKSQHLRLLSVSFVLLCLTASAANAQLWKQSQQLPLCSKLPSSNNNNPTLQASSGAQMACFGVQSNGAPQRAITPLVSSVSGDSFATTNVNAANTNEDQTNGTRAFGQSEVSIAAAGPYVVEAWNDATGFFAPVCASQNKDQLTGLGFSANGGKSFFDLGGLPNVNCATSVFQGDPSVEVFQTGGNTYFYVSSLFFNTSDFSEQIAMDVCQVTGSTLTCNPTPVIIADPGAFGFDDKDFMAIDAARGLLYVTYTDFSFGDTIKLSVCDIGNGALGGSPAAPVCNSKIGPTPGYLSIATSNSCAEIEGAYPAVDAGSGDIYVAFESNWATNLFGCNTIPVQDVMNFVPASCIALPGSSPCRGPAARKGIPIVSIDSAFVSGYNRFPPNDFPRPAVSDVNGTVSMVWNDTRKDVLGNILLQSFNLTSLSLVQSLPVPLDNDGIAGNLHFMPALRNVDAHGNLNVTWYDRRLNPNSASTDVFGAFGVNPRTTTTPTSNTRVTNVSSDWLAVSSDIIPNFGDYTDNYMELLASPGVSTQAYVAWSDGRINDPQPFNAHQGLP